ncbi:uncharacterized protein EV422DRAFT_373110 [Fimicolochytrium jonesii]|uniref:uncharacterized protein n=1 Tax=Fimicolochytrium jonesii TaxID=1396493 RepID=UPI0022FE6C43|nr:uncharacterized protein EV422DRAFT_373110 [Fimicolochytrium jonesii]KAI8815560.1 hypothetical protein EV422DRAFT_373110 [Fimicolochytrium jonesii]
MTPKESPAGKHNHSTNDGSSNGRTAANERGYKRGVPDHVQNIISTRGSSTSRTSPLTFHSGVIASARKLDDRSRPGQRKNESRGSLTFHGKGGFTVNVETDDEDQVEEKDQHKSASKVDDDEEVELVIVPSEEPRINVVTVEAAPSQNRQVEIVGSQTREFETLEPSTPAARRRSRLNPQEAFEAAGGKRFDTPRTQLVVVEMPEKRTSRMKGAGGQSAGASAGRFYQTPHRRESLPSSRYSTPPAMTMMTQSTTSSYDQALRKASLKDVGPSASEMLASSKPADFPSIQLTHVFVNGKLVADEENEPFLKITPDRHLNFGWDKKSMLPVKRGQWAKVYRGQLEWDREVGVFLVVREDAGKIVAFGSFDRISRVMDKQLQGDIENLGMQSLRRCSVMYRNTVRQPIPAETRKMTRATAALQANSDQGSGLDEPLQSSVRKKQVKKHIAPPDKELFRFPFDQKVAVTVRVEDYDRLQDGEYLNDVVIEFFMKWLALQGVNKEHENEVHFFNSFFFEQLSYGQTGKKNSPDDSGYERVKKWTKSIKLFEKKYIFVPINENMHWYLALIYNPGALLKEEEEVCGTTLEDQNMSRAIEESLRSHAITDAQPEAESAVEEEVESSNPVVTSEGASRKRRARSPTLSPSTPAQPAKKPDTRRSVSPTPSLASQELDDMLPPAGSNDPMEIDSEDEVITQPPGSPMEVDAPAGPEEKAADRQRARSRTASPKEVVEDVLSAGAKSAKGPPAKRKIEEVIELDTPDAPAEKDPFTWEPDDEDDDIRFGVQGAGKKRKLVRRSSRVRKPGDLDAQFSEPSKTVVVSSPPAPGSNKQTTEENAEVKEQRQREKTVQQLKK